MIFLFDKFFLNTKVIKYCVNQTVKTYENSRLLWIANGMNYQIIINYIIEQCSVCII